MTGVPSDVSIEFSVVMPCLNEAATLATCIRKARNCLARLGIAGEVVVADNGSTDGSAAIATEEGARVISVPVRGYGAALFAGACEARGRFVIMGDADDSYDFSALDSFVDALRAGADLVIGNRFRGDIRPGAMPWKNRYIGNPVLSAIGRRLFGSDIGDFHCGLRGISKDAFARLDLQTTGMEFASEMIVKAVLLGMRVSEVPTVLTPDGRNRPPHLRPWRDGWRHLTFMFLFSPRWLFLYPGIALITAGLGGYVAIARGLDTNAVPWVLASSVAVLLGFNSVVFAFCARIYAFNQRFVPQDERLERLFRYFKLEGGLLAGAGLLGAGAAGVWWSVRHGAPATLLVGDSRTWLVASAASATALVVGGQMILGSFLFSLFGIRRRFGPPAEEALRSERR
jgi:glycosyltransferase involved in cell wall biosynthesis